MNYGWILSKYICIKFRKNKNLTFNKEDGGRAGGGRRRGGTELKRRRHKAVNTVAELGRQWNLL